MIFRHVYYKVNDQWIFDSQDYLFPVESIICFSNLEMWVVWQDLSKIGHDHRKVAQIYGIVEFSLAAEMATLWIPVGRGHVLLLGPDVKSWSVGAFFWGGAMVLFTPTGSEVQACDDTLPKEARQL